MHPADRFLELSIKQFDGIVLSQEEEEELIQCKKEMEELRLAIKNNNEIIEGEK